jgi:hypothetical protein
MKYEIKNCWTQQVQFTAEIDCDGEPQKSIFLNILGDKLPGWR